MFDTSLIESTAALRTQNRWPTIISFALQAALATLIVTLPLLHPERVLIRPMHMTLTAPPIPRPELPKPPTPRIRVTPTESTTAPVAPTTSQPIIPHSAAHPIETSGPDTAPTVSNLNLSGPATSPLPLASGPPSAHASIAVASSTPHSPGPTSISTGVSAGMLLAPIHPIYPPIARAAHQQGTVEVEAIISKAGHVESAEAVSGPPMLRAAAVEAVRSARYRPFQLNNQPTEVNARFSIHFTLSN